jgi:hypothetical protein
MSVFEVLDRDRQEEAKADRRTVIAAQERARSRFQSFLANGRGSEANFAARLALVDDAVRRVAEDVAAEHGGDPERAYLAATYVLGGHKDGCECGFCANKGSFGQDPKGEIEDDEKTASTKTACCDCGHDDCADCGPDCGCGGKKVASWAVVAADVETGDNYQQERVDLPAADESGLGEPSPRIDKGKSGDHTGWDLDPIDVGSERHRLDKQDIAGGWKWEREGEDGPISISNPDLNDPDFLKDGDSPVRTHQSPEDVSGADSGDRTKTWSGSEGQADAVTSRYHVVAAE